MSCGGRVYKGDSITISIPFDVSGYTDLTVSYFTIGDTKIVRDESGLTIEDGYITSYFEGHDLDLLPDGVVRYTIEYAVENTDYVESSNTMLYLKTPASYSGKTEDEIFQSGYTAGYDDCGGGDCSEVESIAYSSGITKGMADQRALLGSQTFTSNQTATNPNGWSSVTVNVPKEVVLGTLISNPLKSELSSDRYWIREFDSGTSITDGWGMVRLDMKNMMDYGKAQQKALLSSTAITDNGTYTREDGWSSVTVNVTCPDCPACDCTEAYQSGLTVGAAEQKVEDDAKITPILNVRSNGTYVSEYGYGTVNVNVPEPQFNKTVVCIYQGSITIPQDTQFSEADDTVSKFFYYDYAYVRIGNKWEMDKCGDNDFLPAGTYDLQLYIQAYIRDGVMSPVYVPIKEGSCTVSFNSIEVTSS